MRAAASIVAILAVALACGESRNAESASSDSPEVSADRSTGGRDAGDRSERASGAPRVEERYQESIDEAWKEALSGENPSTSCAAIKGRAVASAAGSAERAVRACNIDIPVRYFLTVAERVEAGEKTCNDMMMAIMTELPAMTISMEGFRDLAGRGGDADTSEAAAAAAGTAILAGEAADEGGASDPRQAVKERLRERVTDVCPEEGLILR